MNFRQGIFLILKRVELLLKRRSLPLALTVALCVLISGVEGAVLHALSPSQEDVSNAIDLARDGDTVLVPAGVGYWTSTLGIVNKAITLQGAGTNQTVLVDEVANRQPMLWITFANTSGMFRMTGFQFTRGTTNKTQNANGTIAIRGSNFEFNNSAWRIDHCYFNKQLGRPIYIYAWSGLVDHCSFNQAGSPGLAFDGRIPDSSNKGHRSWATPVRWGTIDAGVYVEDCFISNTSMRAFTDGFAGARFVFRYNTCYNVAAENHGTESTTIFRGTRSMEIYGNKFNSTIFAGAAVYFRSGTGVVFSNSVTGKFPALLQMVNYRERDPYPPYGQADGANPFDLNYPIIFASGMHTDVDGSDKLVDSTASWTKNQWAGYQVRNLTTGKSGSVRSNSTTAIFFNATIQPGSFPIWANGDSYEIRKVDRVLDGCGQGQGDLLVGGSGTPPVSPTPVAWPHQADDPIYYWGNSGITSVGTGGYSTIIADRNYSNTPKPNYTPFVYPHPLASDDPTVPRTLAPSNLRAVGSN